MILILIAAPLLALALPDAARAQRRVGIWGATTTFFVALWFWHMPAPYDATFHVDARLLVDACDLVRQRASRCGVNCCSIRAGERPSMCLAAGALDLDADGPARRGADTCAAARCFSIT